MIAKLKSGGIITYRIMPRFVGAIAAAVNHNSLIISDWAAVELCSMASSFGCCPVKPQLVRRRSFAVKFGEKPTFFDFT
jgi:hypothetical protein